MRRLMLACAAIVVTAAAAHAQPTLFTSNRTPNPGTAVTVTVTGTAGHSFAVLSASSWSGFAYAGVELIGPDVAILGTGVLDGTGKGSATFTPPFPARDKVFVQGVTSGDGFATISQTFPQMVINSQDARVFMPIGAIVQANGTPTFMTAGMTVTKSGSVYTFNHPNFFDFASPIPSVSVTGTATITSIQTNMNQTVVTLSADAPIFITIQTVRR